MFYIIIQHCQDPKHLHGFNLALGCGSYPVVCAVHLALRCCIFNYVQHFWANYNLQQLKDYYYCIFNLTIKYNHIIHVAIV